MIIAIDRDQAISGNNLMEGATPPIDRFADYMTTPRRPRNYSCHLHSWTLKAAPKGFMLSSAHTLTSTIRSDKDTGHILNMYQGRAVYTYAIMSSYVCSISCLNAALTQVTPVSFGILCPIPCPNEVTECGTLQCPPATAHHPAELHSLQLPRAHCDGHS